MQDVQAWLAGPSGNHGWMLKSTTGLDTLGNTVTLEDTAMSFLGFWSREGAAANSQPINGIPALAPTLTVTYIPEPAIAGLAAGALPLALRRRRRMRATEGERRA